MVETSSLACGGGPTVIFDDVPLSSHPRGGFGTHPDTAGARIHERQERRAIEQRQRRTDSRGRQWRGLFLCVGTIVAAIPDGHYHAS